MVVVAATCGDLSTEPGITPLTVIQYAGAPNPSLFVGDTTTLPFDVMIGSIRQPTARYRFSSGDPDIIGVTAGGDSLIIRARGTTLVTATLVSATVGTDTSRQASVTVVAQPFNNEVRPTAEQTFRSLGDTLHFRGVSTTRDGVELTGGSTTWRSLDPAIVSVDAVGVATAVANGQTSIVATFEGVDEDSTVVTVSQLLSRYNFDSRFNLNTSINFRALGDTAAVTALPVDGNGNSIASGFPPTMTMSQSTVGLATTSNPAVVVLTSIGNTGDAAALCAASASLPVPSCLSVTVQQVTTTLSLPLNAVTIPSIGDTLHLVPTVRDSLGRDVGASGVTWSSSDEEVATVNTDPTERFGLVTARRTGTTIIKAIDDAGEDSVSITVTNLPASVSISPAAVNLLSLGTSAAVSSKLFNAVGDSLTQPGDTVHWVLANPSLASIVVPGKNQATITSLVAGPDTTSLFARTDNGVEERIVLSVSNHPATVRIIPDTITLASIGDRNSTFVVDFQNSLGVALGRDAVNWRSDDISIARMSADGLGHIIAVAPGETVVRAITKGADSATVRDGVIVVVTNAAASMTVTPDTPPTITAFGNTIDFDANVFNSTGAPITNASVTWSIVSGGTFATINSVTGVLTATANGSVTVRATSGSVTVDRAVTIQQNVSATTSGITASPASITASGTSTTTVTVQLRDASSNNITFGGATVALTTTLGSLGSVTDAGGGRYTATLTSGLTAGTATIAGTFNAVAISQNALIPFSAAAASKYVVTTTSTNPLAGDSVTITAQLADANNNSVATAGQVVNWSSTGGGGFASATSATDATGRATMRFGTNTTATSHTVTATTSGTTGISPTITPQAGAATNYTVTTSSASPAAGANVTITAQLRDANGNAVPLSGQKVTWTRSDVNGAFATATSFTDGAGQASVVFTTHIVAGISTTVTATTGALTGTTAAPIVTVPGAASQLTVTTTPSANPQAGVDFLTQPVIQLRDANLNAVSAANVSVSATITAGGGTLGGVTTVQTNGSGVATFADLSISGSNGARTVTYSSAGLTAATSSHTLGSGGASQMAVNAGNGQSATVATNVGTAPSVVVRDASGNAVAGVTVTFTVTGGSGSIDNGGGLVAGPLNVVTLASGVAALAAWRLGTAVGTNTISATTGLGLSGEPATFTATGTVGAAATYAINGGIGQSATVGTAVPTAPSVIVRDANSNPVSGVSIDFAVTGGGGSIASPTGNTVTTNSSGVAALSSWTMGTTAGTNNNTLSATVSGGPLNGSVVNFSASATTGNAQNIISNSVTSQTVVAGQNATAPSVIVRDANNNPVGSVTVTFTVTGGSGTIDNGGGLVAGPLTVNTNATTGIATLAAWRLGTTAGTNTLTAAVSGLAGSPIAFTATGTAGAVTAGNSTVERTGSNNVTANGSSSSTITVTVRDANSNPIS
ncbi:MAG: invasin domain 3-containing protein, partial [Gemmatimonadaceae bacterium]